MNIIKNKISIIAFAALFAIMFCFVFASCGGEPQRQENVTDDGSLNYEATVETNMQHTINDFYATLGSQTTDAFAGCNGMRFTLLKSQQDGGSLSTTRVNGIMTSEGINFAIEAVENETQSINKVITICNQKIYTRINKYDDEGEDVSILTYKQTNETKEVILKNCLQELGFASFDLLSPKKIFNLIDENSTKSVVKRNNNYMISVMNGGILQHTIYANFNQANNLTAVQYQKNSGDATNFVFEQVKLMGFKGTIQFPDFSNYVLEN